MNQTDDRMVKTFESIVMQSSSSSSSSVNYATIQSSSSSQITVETKKTKASTKSKATVKVETVNEDFSPVRHSGGEVRQFTPKTPPKGIISYAARHAELSVSPELAPSLSLNDFDTSYVEAKDVLELTCSSVEVVALKKVGRKRSVSVTTNTTATEVKTDVKVQTKAKRSRSTK